MAENPRKRENARASPLQLLQDLLPLSGTFWNLPVCPPHRPGSLSLPGSSLMSFPGFPSLVFTYFWFSCVILRILSALLEGFLS